jgi:hypothetical protein
MTQLDSFISPLVKEQFPDFYQEDGPLFILFAEEYYKWLETYNEVIDGENVAGKSVYQTRNLLNYRDIDRTVDEFIVYFKEKYLKGVDINVLTNKRLLVKSALDLFRSKGTERSIDLLFKLVFGTKVEVFTPGDHVLKLSDGKWLVPVYLELTRTEKTKSFVGKLVTGSQSGATAVVEYLITRNIKGNLIDIIYISNLTGNFEKDDIINTEGSVVDCPKVIGSLTSIDITLSGQNFTVGEIVNLTSARGVEGKAKVLAVSDETGLVSFELIDGGWGYSTTANTIVSSKVLTLASDFTVNGSVSTFDYVSENLVYNFDSFYVASYVDIERSLQSLGSLDSTLRSFLDTTVTGTSYKVYDTDNSGSMNTADVSNFKKYAENSNTISVGARDWLRNQIMPFVIANTYIKNNYVKIYPKSIPLGTTATQSLFNLTLNNIIGEVSNSDILVTPGGNTCVVASSNKTAYTNNALLIISPINGNTLSASSLAVTGRSVIVTNNSITFNVGDELRHYTSSSITGTGTVTESRPVTIISISGGSSTNNGLAVGNYIFQADTGAYGYISATPKESNYARTNVAVIAVSNTVGTFNNSSALAVYSDNSNTTVIATATSSGVELGRLYNLSSVTGVWNTGSNTSTTTSSNTIIKIGSLVGGTFSSFTNITATGNVVGSNSTAVGVSNISNTFYGTNVSKLSLVIENETLTTPNVSSVSTGTGADFDIGFISDLETVLLSPNRISANNDGPGSNSVKFSEMLICGANSTYGYISDLLIITGGSGYSNTDKITFAGGSSNTSAGNATIVTDSSGVITGVSLSANVGDGYISSPTLTIANSSGGSSSGSGADIVALFPLGFPKLPVGDISYLILDLLTFEQKTIGTIASLTGINPGENYNIDPFALAFEPSVAAYGKRDYILALKNNNGVFTPGELVQQYNTINTVTVVGNNYSGNTSTFDISEYVFTNNGITIAGEGTVRVASESTGVHTIEIENASGTFSNTTNASILTVSTTTGFVAGETLTQSTASGKLEALNANTLVVINVTGTFQANSTNVTGASGSTLISSASNTVIYKLIGLTSNSQLNVTSANNSDTDTVTARGRVISYNVDTGILNVKRISLFTEFAPNTSNYIIGITSGANAEISYAIPDNNRAIIGLNANIAANVVTATGSISNLQIVSSGFGYVQDEGINIVSEDGERVASGKANILNQGNEEGRYTSYDGFTDNYRYLHDGEFYQEFSYEVRTQVPFDSYKDMLKSILHVAGTRMFGKYVTSSLADSTISVANSSITIA